MAPKPALQFTLAFSVVTLLEIIGDVLAVRWLHYGCKPLIIGLLLIYTWRSYQSVVYPGIIRWILIGMGFALAGDVFLMIQEVDLFAPGLGAFLVMQVCYCVAFLQSIRQSGHSVRMQSLGLKALPFLLYVISFLTVLRPVFAHTPALSVMWWPVVIYAICLGTMGLLSTQRQGLPYSNQVVAGAMLFLFSDSIIAIDKFLTPVTGAPWLIMSTYAAAQYLIVVGMVQTLSTPKEPDWQVRPSRVN